MKGHDEHEGVGDGVLGKNQDLKNVAHEDSQRPNDRGGEGDVKWNDDGAGHQIGDAETNKQNVGVCELAHSQKDS